MPDSITEHVWVPSSQGMYISSVWGRKEPEQTRPGQPHINYNKVLPDLVLLLLHTQLDRRHQILSEIVTKLLDTERMRTS
jgi:hypothetical protein